MENASKALIIAGAILIAILLISVGIMVMNSTSGVQEGMQQQMDTTAVQQFNAKFDPYIGSKKTASDVKSLISVMQANNKGDSNHMNNNRYVYLNIEDIHNVPNISSSFSATYSNYGWSSNFYGVVAAAVDNTKTYTITAKDEGMSGSATAKPDGYYSLITIKEN